MEMEDSRMEDNEDVMRAFVAIQRSGVTNMFDIVKVTQLINALSDTKVTEEQVGGMLYRGLRPLGPPPRTPPRTA